MHVAFRQACSDGDSAAAERLLVRIDDPAVTALVKRIGGPRALIRFLVQRRHLLHADDSATLQQWLVAHLCEAEPMHLLNVGDLLHAAEGHEPIQYRLKAHLKFVQPPDPTRWSRKLITPAESAFLDACGAGDVDAVRLALAVDPSIVHARDKWRRDAATLASGQDAADDMLALLCAAGVHKTADPLIAAARRGATSMVRALLELGFPQTRAIEEHVLWWATQTRSPSDFDALAVVLVDAGADPNAVDRWGTTVWGAASPAMRPGLRRLGALPEARGASHYDPATGCSPAMVTGERIDPSEELDLNEAAAVGDVEQVRHWLDDVYRLTPTVTAVGSPERPLHVAAFFGRIEVVWLLIREYGYSPAELNDPLPQGAHVGPAATWGKSALEIAVTRGHTRVVDMLMNSVDWFQGRRARRK